MRTQRIYNNPNHTNQILQFELILVGYFLILPKLHDIFTEKRKKMPFYTQNHILFVVLLHNIQLQLDSEAQRIGYLIRRRICQSQ